MYINYRIQMFGVTKIVLFLHSQLTKSFLFSLLIAAYW